MRQTKTPQSMLDGIARYQEKNYKRISMVFRYDTDKELMEELEQVVENGIPYREYLTDLFHKAKLWEESQMGKYPIWLDNKEDAQLIQQLKRVESKGIDRKMWILNHLKV